MVTKLDVKLNNSLVPEAETAKIKRMLNGVDSFSFRYPSGARLRQRIDPLQYSELTISTQRERVLTGTVVRVDGNLTERSKMVAIAGYSLPGILMDCTAPVESLPLEFNRLSLLEIARRLSKPFGLQVEGDAAASSVFERVSLGVRERVWPFLNELAGQKNLLLGNDSRGRLTLFRAGANDLAGRLKEGSAPLVAGECILDGQQYWNRNIGYNAEFPSAAGTRIILPSLTKGVRTRGYMFDDTRGRAELDTAVRSQRGRSYALCARWKLQVVGWENPKGNLWKPGQSINFQSETLYCPDDTKLLIDEVELNRNQNVESSVLSGVLSGSYHDQPGRFPWA